jgi:predicted metal-binding membrane protein
VYDVREHRLRVAAALRWRPEWWIAVVVVLAWVALLAGVGWHGDEAGYAARGVAAVELHAHGHATPATDPAHGPHHESGGLLAALSDWTLMTVAMMAPVTLPAVRHVGFNSIRRRRQWAMALYFAVYVGVWVAFGALVLAGERLARETFGFDGRVLLALALAIAAGWQLTRVKRQALFRCRRTVPLPPIGLRADMGCARFALQQGWRCMISCWALMVVMAVVGHYGLMWMVALTVLIMVEELTLLGRRLLRPSAIALTLAAGLVAFGV